MSMKKIAIVASLSSVLLVGCGGNVDDKITSNYTKVVEAMSEETYVKSMNEELGVSFEEISISCIKEILPTFDEETKEGISEAISKKVDGDDFEAEDRESYRTWEMAMMRCVDAATIKKQNSQ